MENNELQHYGVVGMKWGVRKKVYASESQRKKQHKENMNEIKTGYNRGIRTMKTAQRYASHPDFRKAYKKTENELRVNKKSALAYEKDRYKYHHSKKGDTDFDAYSRIRSNNENIAKAKKAYKKDPSDANKKSFEQAYEAGLLYKRSDAYKKYMQKTYITGALAGPGAAAGREFAMKYQHDKIN